MKIRPLGAQFFHADGQTDAPARQPTHKSLNALYSSTQNHSSIYLPQILLVIEQMTRICASYEKRNSHLLSEM